MIILKTLSFLYGFDGSEARSPGTVESPVRADPYNVITEFCVINLESPYNTIIERPWIYIIRAIPSTYHQLLKYPIPSGMSNKGGDQAMARAVAAVAWKRSGWAQKASRASPNEDSLADKKHRIADQ